jgi:FkbM family methyltransferase
MKQTHLMDGTPVYCLRAPEAKTLDHHVEGYLQHGIEINNGDIVFDVGANIGVFGVRAIQNQPLTKVYCFEPIPAIYEVLKANAKNTDENRLIALPYGVSDVNTQATFSYFPNTPALSTLHPEEWDNNPGAFKKAVKGTMKNPPAGMKWMRLIPTFFAGAIANHLVKGKMMVECQIRKTSDIIDELKVERIDLLKIDCEGAELGVIKGIDEKDWPKIKSVVVEIHDQDGRLDFIKNLLESKGFKQIHLEVEKGLEETQLVNLFATR